MFGEPDLGWRDRYAAHGTEEGQRPWHAGALPIERTGTAPADGIVEGDGQHPSVTDGTAPEHAARIVHPERTGHEAQDAYDPDEEDRDPPGPDSQDTPGRGSMTGRADWGTGKVDRA